MLKFVKTWWSITILHIEIEQPIVCLEFFSGIGGLHYGIQESGISYRMAMAFDMNENANDVYEYSFGQRPNNKAIDYLTIQDIDRHKADCWLLSPPCQPYTRGGNYGDNDDPRARGLMHILDLLPQLQHRPSYILLENVMNFETSQSRNLLIKVLGKLGFKFYECLLSPIQFGIPNNRLRYFLIARLRRPDPCILENKSNCQVGLNTTHICSEHTMWLSENIKLTENYLSQGKEVIYTEWPFGPAVKTITVKEIIQRPLYSYVDTNQNTVLTLQVSASDILRRRRLEFDIVQPSSTQTSTFTKAYGSKHLIGSGSLLQTQQMDITENGFNAPEKLLNLGLRFFSPKEVARLHHFPEKDFKHTLKFPSRITQRQQLQLLGNSLNVHVVAQLLKHILFCE
ncbi:S-adenosyl-L-methionine-dependent methyltransferase [Coemansia reversa NRRL 1564]|uniref:tRNA (cytosine(38)-C(5))-methyltransferase n=1 Tax=Coemansia reversa (strain ATCC 12441 / NRRL 1564) TaxID=763665 RepID=A0A2G5BB74_COERN|nr:S-adenosyl-L-methionine-dependent methyltransferase [Coemansia reversa NRRL 1564]|eukprot:PIA16261.1 S-adenosyl-L-methionine-dependent methyltransferase [Coemansia reversa NRRL 1564]